jgi:hypothetical protein
VNDIKDKVMSIIPIKDSSKKEAWVGEKQFYLC